MSVDTKKAFAALVRRLREEHEWSQRQLDRISNIPWRTIFDIEHGDKANLDYRTVSILCEAFKLSGQDRREFFLTAGLKPDVEQDVSDWSSVVKTFYADMKFPAFVIDTAFYIASANTYMAAILGLTFEQFLDKHRLYNGVHILHFLFDADFRSRDLYGEHWAVYATLNTYLFRQVAENHLHEVRYQRTVSQLRGMEDFNRIWEASNQSMSLPGAPYSITLHHALYGTLQYWHSQPVMPDAFFEQFRTVFYSPADAATEMAFNRMREDVPYAAYRFPSDIQHGSLESILDASG
jgi:hypothetical protein